MNLFANGEIVAVVPGYIAVTGLAASQGVKLKHIIPSEGAASYADAWAIPALKPSLRTLFPYSNIDGWFKHAPLYDLPSNRPGIVQYNEWLAKWAAFKAS